MSDKQDKVLQQVKDLLAGLAGKGMANPRATVTAPVSNPYDRTGGHTDEGFVEQPPEGEPDFGYKPQNGAVRVLSLDEARAQFGEDFLQKLFGNAAPDRVVASPGLPEEPQDEPTDLELEDFFNALTGAGGEECAIIDVLEEVHTEVHRAEKKHKPQTSPHGAYAVLLEEVDELWEEIKKNNGRGADARKEAIQIAAMAVRYVLDQIDEVDDNDDKIEVTLA